MILMLIPNWSAPKNITACTLTKDDSLDDLPLKLHLLNQVHGNEVLDLANSLSALTADGVYTQAIETPCSIKTADCLAVFLCDQQGTEIAALHAGWRGLAQGVIFQGVRKFHAHAKELIAWLSPAICAKHYEIDRVVYDSFMQQALDYRDCFKQSSEGHWYCDLQRIARMQLEAMGVTQIFSDDLCTFENEADFYSYRREPKNPGRLIHTLWINSESLRSRGQS
jgi:YfiH family protein